MPAFPYTGIVDTFDRADENPIAGNWTNDALGEGANNQLRILSNQVKAVTAATSCEAYYNAAQYNENIEVYFTVITIPGASQRVECGFIQAPGNTANTRGYTAQIANSADTSQIGRFDAGGGATVIASTTSITYTTNDVLGLRRSAGGVLQMFKNGVVVLEGVDNTYTGKFYLELCIRDTTGIVDSFGGGEFPVQSGAPGGGSYRVFEPMRGLWSAFAGNAWNYAESWQYQPRRTRHDPNPPIVLESPSSVPFPRRATYVWRQK